MRARGSPVDRAMKPLKSDEVVQTGERPEPGAARILAIGDVHLGRRPSSLPPELAEAGVDPRELTPEKGLDAAVEWAIGHREGIDAVCFAGDVVQSTNARFEALPPLERCTRRLLDAGIQVLGVAGNHDVDALPRLARLVEGFQLLGEGGEWESCVIERDGEPLVEVLGWSFPEEVVRSSPAASLLSRPVEPARPGLARIGLLHADLDASGGGYAPVSRRDLERAGLDAWLLGHFHKPTLEPARGGAPLGYLGSLVGLDPTETGIHGPWLVTVGGPGRVRVEQIPLAPLRWDSVELELEGRVDPADAEDRILDALQSRAREILEHGHRPLALGLRVRLVGRVERYLEIREHVASRRWKGRARTVEGVHVFVDEVFDSLSLARDLGEIAAGEDPPAILARALLALGGEEAARRELLEELRPALARAAAHLPCLESDRMPDDEELAALARRAATSALGALLESSDPAGGGR